MAQRFGGPMSLLSRTMACSLQELKVEILSHADWWGMGLAVDQLPEREKETC